MSKFKVGDRVIFEGGESATLTRKIPHNETFAGMWGAEDDTGSELIIAEDEMRHQTSSEPNPTTLTRRDRFAMSAMCGLIAQSNGTALSSTPAIGADFAYRIADAMEAARNKEGGE